ncbi:hypothetical protein [Methylomonas fluvii]|uniref:Uncharacterized protein n=1 Tax=Methylomonas fluvii TaxID=1854564 RepID=A0ABR9DIA4_9GAMM|nr:hypothetical protein [Methylomonas fluvii]MBD9362780.1 hypothetical protein [Methylomonas fluvii]
MKSDEFEQRLLELKTIYEKQNRSRVALREAFGLCTQNCIPLPEWVVYGLEHVLGCSDIDDKLSELGQIYSSGHLGAIADAVSLCYQSSQPIPHWVHSGLRTLLYSLSANKQEFIKGWLSWGKRYRKDMENKQIYDTFKIFMEEGFLTRDHAFLVSGVEYFQEIPDGLDSSELKYLDGEKLAFKIENICKKVEREIKKSPYRYRMLMTLRLRKLPVFKNHELYRYIQDVVSTSKPKRKKTQ